MLLGTLIHDLGARISSALKARGGAAFAKALEGSLLDAASPTAGASPSSGSRSVAVKRSRFSLRNFAIWSRSQAA